MEYRFWREDELVFTEISVSMAEVFVLNHVALFFLLFALAVVFSREVVLVVLLEFVLDVFFDIFVLGFL